MVTQFLPDPHETFEVMVARLTGQALTALREPAARSLDRPPYPHPDADKARMLERLYPDRVKVRYSAPVTHYLLDDGRLTFSFTEAEPGFPPLPGETAAEYTARNLQENSLGARDSGFTFCAGLGFTVADIRALQAQDPDHVLIGFAELHGRYFMRIEGSWCFLFPAALDDGRGADIPLNGGEDEL